MFPPNVCAGKESSKNTGTDTEPPASHDLNHPLAVIMHTCPLGTEQACMITGMGSRAGCRKWVGLPGRQTLSLPSCTGARPTPLEHHRGRRVTAFSSARIVTCFGDQAELVETQHGATGDGDRPVLGVDHRPVLHRRSIA